MNIEHFIRGTGRGRAGSSLYRRHFKRVLDVALILAALPFVLPLMALMAAAVALGGGRPFYTQPRLGRGGRVFRLVKIRTMVLDADAALDRHLAADPAARAEWDAKQKLARDPRITRIGRVLRKTSLDELPQLWNVLTGDMSLVGPRPMMVSQRDLYPGTAYFELRPGITGPWQVSERHGSDFAARARYDADYLDDLTLGTDLSILTRTVGVVAGGKGA
jgi:lipopolysaccharide/colanic/teichoic acid biosynthesis glycosyltransferase